MPIKLNGATSGSIELDVPASIGSDINFTLPGSDGTSGQVLTTNGSGTFSFANEGKVLQIIESSNFSRTSSSLQITQPTAGSAALYGFVHSNRTYGDIESITITPKSATSKLFLSATVGFFGYNPRSSHGAHGLVFVENNTTGYDFSDYPGYDTLYIRTVYPAPEHISMSIDNTNTNTRTWYLKGFSYNEGSGNANNTLVVRNSSFTIMEIEQ